MYDGQFAWTTLTSDVQGNLYRKEGMKKGSSKVQQRYYDWIHSSQRSAMYVPPKRGNKTAQDWDKKHAVDDAFQKSYT